MNKTLQDIRLENARALLEEAGNQAVMAERLDVRPNYISRVVGKNPSKGIGHNLARKMEREFDRPRGWMDKDHSVEAAAGIQEGPADHGGLSADEAELLAIYRSLSRAGQYALMAAAHEKLENMNAKTKGTRGGEQGVPMVGRQK